MALTMQDTCWRFTDHREWRDHFRRWPPVIITCAITGGGHGKETNPNLPESPEEQADSCYGAYKAGASIVHIHARDPEINYVGGKTSSNPKDFYKVNKLIRQKCPDMLINNTCGGAFNMDLDGMRHYFGDARPELATLDVGALFIRRWERARPGVKGREEDRFVERSIPLGFSLTENLARAEKESNVKAELELFSTQSWWFVDNLIEKKLVDPPYWLQLVFGQEGACSPPTPKSAMEIIANLPPQSLFSTIGIAALQLPIITIGIIMGGHVRVGFEDNVYYSRGVKAESNAQLVERAVRLVREFNREVATPAQAREMLNLSQTPSQYP